jgi:glutathione S-transferase
MSTCTRCVALIAKEVNIHYELIPVDFQVAEHKQPAHLQHQPFGQIPYITVRHFCLALSYDAVPLFTISLPLSFFVI